MRPPHRSPWVLIALLALAACSGGDGAGDAATTRDVPLDAIELLDAFDAASPDAAPRDVAVDAAADARTDATMDVTALDARDALAETGTDATSEGLGDAPGDGARDVASACGLVGNLCDYTDLNSCIPSSGFDCYGGVPDAGAHAGVCLNSHVGRTVCGDGTNHCPTTAERCYRPFHICLSAAEVPCVCVGAAAAACTPP